MQPDGFQGSFEEFLLAQGHERNSQPDPRFDHDQGFLQQEDPGWVKRQEQQAMASCGTMTVRQAMQTLEANNSMPPANMRGPFTSQAAASQSNGVRDEFSSSYIFQASQNTPRTTDQYMSSPTREFGYHLMEMAASGLNHSESPTPLPHPVTTRTTQIWAQRSKPAQTVQQRRIQEQQRKRAQEQREVQAQEELEIAPQQPPYQFNHSQTQLHLTSMQSHNQELHNQIHLPLIFDNQQRNQFAPNRDPPAQRMQAKSHNPRTVNNDLATQCLQFGQEGQAKFNQLHQSIHWESELQATQLNQSEGRIKLDDPGFMLKTPDTRRRVHSWVTGLANTPLLDPNTQPSPYRGTGKRKASLSREDTPLVRDLSNNRVVGTQTLADQSPKRQKICESTKTMRTERAPDEDIMTAVDFDKLWPEGWELTKEQADMVKEDVGLELSDPYKVWSLDDL